MPSQDPWEMTDLVAFQAKKCKKNSTNHDKWGRNQPPPGKKDILRDRRCFAIGRLKGRVDVFSLSEK